MSLGRHDKFELHYYFEDGSHSIDAVLRNDTERELLALIRECRTLLGIDFSVEAEAWSEGGLRDIWRITGAPQTALVVAVLALVMSRYPPTDSERERMETELIELQTEEARLNIKRLRQELGEKALDEEGRDGNARAADEITKSSKVLVRRSNFYARISKSKKITSISFTQLNAEGVPVGPERVVPREKFPNFFVNTKSLKPIVNESAEIEVVSPVLREGNYKWKGIFDGDPISFSMTDSAFRAQVRNRQVSFQNGSYIVCVLETQRELDEAGEIKITGYSVSTVIRKEDASQSFETPQGREYKQAKRYHEGQSDFFEHK